MDDAILDSLRRAVDAAPGDVPLRIHLGRMLLGAGRADEATAAAADALAVDPSNDDARALMRDALGAQHPEREPGPWGAPGPRAFGGPRAFDGPRAFNGPRAFDWDAAEQQVADTRESRFGVEEPRTTFADFAGMEAVAARFDEYRGGGLLGGGLLMYGPPGCGKTYVARAVAGSLGARFLGVGITDVLDPYLGNSERNLHDAFVRARLAAPCVLFLDEVDALGQRRSHGRGSLLHGVVGQLLAELDGTDGSNDGVFVLAATNRPWDVDPALRRPGRIDRTVLVLPPDRSARASILHGVLAAHPVGRVDVALVARRTDGYSGADLTYVADVAADRARRDHGRPITTTDLLDAVAAHRPSTSSWFASARNVVLFGDDDGTFAELRDHLKRTKRR